MQQPEITSESSLLNLHRQLINNAGMGMILCATDGCVQLINTWAAMEFGATPATLTHKKLPEFLPPEIATSFMAHLSRTARTSSGGSFEEPFTIREERHWYLSSFYPIFSESGTLEGVQIVFIDSTDRKTMEEKLTRQVSELESVNKLAVGRELRMIELKEEINSLCKQIGKADRYVIHRPRYLEDTNR